VQRDDAVAAPARLAGRRRLGAAASGAAAAAGRRGQDRLGPRQRGRLAGARQGRGQKGGAAVGPNPTDRGKPGTHHQLIAERGGAPLAAFSTAANVNEGTVLERLVAAIPPRKRPRSRPGRPRRRPAKRRADKADDSAKNRRLLRRRHITPRIARRGIDSSERRGRHRGVAERDVAWLHRNRRLLVREERRPELHQAFLELGCALICWHLLTRGS
jgi:hypothetical protein